MDDLRIDDLRRDLLEKVRGDVLTDRMSRLIYSTDASLYQLIPTCVVAPRDENDVYEAMQSAVRHAVPILPRGGGTSLAGQTVTRGLVLDFSKYMNQVLELNAEDRWARVQPGIVLDNLNAHLRPHGLFFAPDVATSSRANIGGMMGNNSAGVRSVRYGKTVDHVLGMSAILSGGERYTFDSLNRTELNRKCRSGTEEGALYRTILQIVSDNRALIEEKFPKVMRRVSGYNLDELLDEDRFNLAKLLVGSEGTLASVVEARLNLEKIPAVRAIAVLHFRDMIEAIRCVERILQYEPSAIEILDEYGLELAKENPTVARLCSLFLNDSPQAILIVEFSGELRPHVEASLEGLKQDDTVMRHCFYTFETWDDADQQTVWQVRKNALGVMLSIKGDAKPLPFIEDSCIPVHHLATYISQIQEICREYNRRVAMYAHASVGVIHVRPILNLKQTEDVEIMQKISERAFQLVLEYGGSWSGEHGDGLVRSYKVKEFFGEQIYEAFRQVKKTFDPKGLMNPGKIVDSPSMVENLRIHPGYEAKAPETFFRFQEESDLVSAIEMCTGVGQCRKTLAGTMCPSYIATRDEEHSTRGRANALRSALSGELGADAFTSQRLYEVLDLCLECKACKSECPSHVDMAKMKAEFLAHFYQKHGVPFAKRLIGKTHRGAELASRAPALANLLLQNGLSRWLLEKTAGIDRRRRLPSFAKRTFMNIHSNRFSGAKHSSSAGQVILFADTFMNYYQPEIGTAARAILEALGFQVVLGKVGCCGRPLISAGLLERARKEGGHMIKRLLGVADGACPIIVLEPSCYSTLKDDYPDLISDRDAARKIAARVTSLEEFLAGDSIEDRLSEVIGRGPESVLFHGHCQQKALIGSEPSLHLLQQLKGTTVKEVPPGCCGMAGAFGYEKEHYHLSRKIGERHLLPAVREADPATALVVSGFSCRCQIEHFTGRKAQHPAEVVARSLRYPG